MRTTSPLQQPSERATLVERESPSTNGPAFRRDRAARHRCVAREFRTDVAEPLVVVDGVPLQRVAGPFSKLSHHPAVPPLAPRAGSGL
jgi:hypothetical protein